MTASLTKITPASQDNPS